ncbi:MAG: hypothetical protein RMX65_032750 [Nostoc sp. DedQUE01]|nr:hypothetical protein [Nostoc sp. DedQUE11]MDZ8074193.1 hypothetical protein [Nostoc sp. DedQUE01]MDZ8081619.1 hypothetical protein [Nostoc sp. DcaGUA01]
MIVEWFTLWIGQKYRFTNEYHDVQVIVTSRVIGYKPQRLKDAANCLAKTATIVSSQNCSRTFKYIE